MPNEKIDMKKLRKNFQKAVGSSPKVQSGSFTNWASTQVLHELLTVTPDTVSEAQAVVRAARRLGLRVRAAGSGHSWSPLFADQGHVLMYMSKLKRPDGPRLELIQDIKDPHSKYVTVATGVTSAEFKEFQLAHGVCLPTNVILGGVQMGGVISTGCHGAGWSAKTISDYVAGIRLVDSTGELRHFTIKDNPEEMKALQCSLGLWGIIVDITFKVDPMMIVESQNLWMKVKDLFFDQQNLQKLLQDNWSVELFWFPFNGITRLEAIEAFMERSVDLGEWDPLEDEVWVRVVNPPSRVGTLTQDKTYKLMEIQAWWRMKGFDMVEGFVSKFPQVAPSFLKSQVPYLKQQNQGTLVQHLPHAIHFISNVEEVPVNEMEWAFNIDPDCRNLCRATQKVVELVQAEAMEGRFPMNLPLELRFIGDSQAFMSPAIGAHPSRGGSGHACFIEILTVAGTPHWKEFSQKVANVWKDLSAARPHWGKEWEHLEGIDDCIRQAYSKDMPEFLKLLEQSKVDPDGMFFNSRLEQLFYPNGHPTRPEQSEDFLDKLKLPDKPDCNLQ